MTSTPTSPIPTAAASDEDDLQCEIVTSGTDVGSSFAAVLRALPDNAAGPAELGRRLGIDKVLASRVIKAANSHDPIAVIHQSPGPEPLRRFLKAARKAGVDSSIIGRAGQAVDRFDQLIRNRIGDRSSLDAIISSWLPEARAEFELRRKQSLFKAMSQLKGAMVRTTLATVFLHPSEDQQHIDVTWVTGLLGLMRLRPGANVKLSTRKMDQEHTARSPRTLTGETVDHLHSLCLTDFCSEPIPDLEVKAAGNAVHYILAGGGYGPGSAIDLVFAEANFREMARYVEAGSNRKGYVFAEIATPARLLHFDVFVHDAIYPNSHPQLLIYDTALEGVANINDRSRDIDRIEFAETIHQLGQGIDRFRSSEVPRYLELIDHVCAQLQWNPAQFRGYRCSIDYPLYGSQVAMAFDPPPPPGRSSEPSQR